MDFKELEAFVKVIELGSFSKAAEDMYLSQPSISNYINSLEESLGTILINRSTKVLSTTLEGEKLLLKANEILKIRHEIYDDLKRNPKNLDGTLRIIASTVPSKYIIPELIEGFHSLYSEVNFIIKESDTLEVVQAIANHRADLGFTGSIVNNNKCSFKEFTSDRLIFIAPKNSQFDIDKEYELEDILYSHKFISREYGSGTRIQYEKYLQENNIALNKIRAFLTLDNTQSVINAVSNNLGISIVSELSMKNSIKNENIIQLKTKNPLPRRKIYTVTNKNALNPHLLTIFLNHIENYPLNNNDKS